MNKLFTYIFLPLLSASALFAADSSGSTGVSTYAYEIGRLFNFPLTNSILTTWVVSIIFILAIRLTLGKPTLIPNKAQVVLETLIDSLRGLLRPILGEKAFKLSFPILLGFFVFILIHNWSGLIPGVGVFGFYDAEGHLKYWLRPANSDLNATLGMALISMIMWLYVCTRVSGLRFIIWELFGNKASKQDTPKAIYLMLAPIFLMVGFIEVISIAFRPISLSFRLFGNVFGGENLLVSMTELGLGLTNWVLPVLLPLPFYIYEILVGGVQALIFTLLVAIYIGLITNHQEDH